MPVRDDHRDRGPGRVVTPRQGDRRRRLDRRRRDRRGSSDGPRISPSVCNRRSGQERRCRDRRGDPFGSARVLLDLGYDPAPER